MTVLQKSNVVLFSHDWALDYLNNYLYTAFFNLLYFKKDEWIDDVAIVLNLN